LFSCKDGVNRIVKVYYFDSKAWSTIDFPFARFVGDGTGNFYGINEDGDEIWTIFTGNTADCADISYYYKQEINVGNPNQIKELLSEDYQFVLNGSTAEIQFDKYDEQGVLTEGALFQEASQDRAGGSGKISNFERLLIKVQGSSDTAVTLNYVGLDIRLKQMSRNRKVTATMIALATLAGEVIETLAGETITLL